MGDATERRERWQGSGEEGASDKGSGSLSAGVERKLGTGRVTLAPHGDAMLTTSPFNWATRWRARTGCWTRREGRAPVWRRPRRYGRSGKGNGARRCRAGWARTRRDDGHGSECSLGPEDDGCHVGAWGAAHGWASSPRCRTTASNGRASRTWRNGRGRTNGRRRTRPWSWRHGR